MAKKIIITETKLKRKGLRVIYEGDGHEDDELMFVTENIELDSLIKDEKKRNKQFSGYEQTKLNLKKSEKSLEEISLPPKKKLLMLPGIGLGPDIFDQLKRVMKWMERACYVSFDIHEGLFDDYYTQNGNTLTDDTIKEAKKADAILFGDFGQYNQGNIENNSHTEQSLCNLVRALDLYVNVRPVSNFTTDGDDPNKKKLLKKQELHDVDTDFATDLDFLMINEADVYDVEYDTDDDLESERMECVFQVAFEMAKKRKNSVTFVETADEKAKSQMLEILQDIHKRNFSEVELNHIAVENCEFQLSRQPENFDILVTDRHTQKMLFDTATKLAGPQEIFPSAYFGKEDKYGKRRALYKPLHNISSKSLEKNTANPLAIILSYAACLQYSFNMEKDASLLIDAVRSVLTNEHGTQDIAKDEIDLISYEQMGEAIVTELKLLVQGFEL